MRPVPPAWPGAVHHVAGTTCAVTHAYVILGLRFAPRVTGRQGSGMHDRVTVVGAGDTSDAVPAADGAGGRKLGALMPVRRAVSRAVPPRTLQGLAGAYAVRAPHALQRWSERAFDFPVGRAVRDAPVLLIRIPRCASTSASLQVYGQVHGIPHRTAAFFRASDPAFFAAAVKVAVVRDPWDRAVSAYRHLVGGAPDMSRPSRRTEREARGITGFADFVIRYLAPNAHRLHALDPVLHTQSSYVCDAAGNVIVDHLVPFGRMDILQDVLAGNGVTRSPSHANASPPGLPTPPMASALREVIGEVYAEDVVRFGHLAAGPW